MSACEDSRAAEGICAAKTPPGASVAARRGKSAWWSERKSNAALAKIRFGGSVGIQSTMSCLTNRARGARVRAWSSIASDVSRPSECSIRVPGECQYPVLPLGDDGLAQNNFDPLRGGHERNGQRHSLIHPAPFR